MSHSKSLVAQTGAAKIAVIGPVIWRRFSQIAGAAGLAALAVLLGAGRAHAQEPVDRSRDRGEGLPVSMFGTYIKAGELLVYPFFEYYSNNDQEYKPSELGYTADADFRAPYGASEGLIFLAYGISDNVAVEFEASTISAWQERSSQDGSGLPARLKQSGLGDVEGQVRWRYNRESASRPEVFSYFETVAPIQRSKLLIGTPDWEFKLGTGIVRGLSWGTITVRGSVANSGGVFEVGEYAVEYLRRLSRRLRVVAVFEGTQDEVALITEAQVFLRPNIFLKLNNGFGVTAKAAEWAPEVGLMISFP